MTGSKPEPPNERWWRHDNGRWVIGDAGRQPEIAAIPAPGRAGTRPDTIIDGASLCGLTYRATSQRGLGHQQAGKPRQDAYLVRPTPDRRWLIGCVADGVSESNLSHEAADLVCQESTRWLARGLNDLAVGRDSAAWRAVVETWPELMLKLPWQEAADRASAEITQVARDAVLTGLTRDGDTTAVQAFEQRPWSHADARKVMSSTAVVFVVSTVAIEDGGHPAAIAVVAGDSAALLLDDGAWRPLTPVKNDGAEIASAAVDPLPRSVHVRPVAHCLRRGQALAVITDGLGDSFGSGGGDVGAFLATHWAAPPDPLAFAYHVGFYRRTFTDDRTAVVIWADREPGRDDP